MKDYRSGRKLAVGKERGKPICLYYTDNSEVLAYFPDGKTKVAKHAEECRACDESILMTANSIAERLNGDNEAMKIISRAAKKLAAPTPRKFSQLLKVMESASQCTYPADNNYAGKRTAVLNYVRQLERELSGVTALRDAFVTSFLERAKTAEAELAAANLRAEQNERDALPSEGFYLQDKRDYVGNDIPWWAKNGNGYTTDLRKAQVFTDTDVAKGAPRDTDMFWPVAYINSISRPAVDMQYAKRADAALKGN